MRVTEKQYEICEGKDWRVRELDDGSIELENWSPAGEDLVFYVDCGEPFAEGVVRIYESFDPEEHAALLIPARGTNGIPNSLRTLIDDAGAIDSMLEELAIALTQEGW